MDFANIDVWIYIYAESHPVSCSNHKIIHINIIAFLNHGFCIASW